MRPSEDPTRDRPGMIFLGGHWRTPEGVERYRESQRRWYRKQLAANPEKIARNRANHRLRALEVH